MFTIEIAKLKIRIDNRFDFVQRHCNDYIVDSDIFDFSVSVSDREMLAEKNISTSSLSDGFIESVCIYRNIARELPKYNAFVLHSAAIENDGFAYCFAAKSGVGKTTHISLWREVYPNSKIINGDKPIVRFFDDHPYVCGTPWGGKENLQSNVIFPLRSICFLQRAEICNIEPIQPHTALTLILQQIYIDKTNADATLDLLNKLLNNTDLWSLRCNISSFAATLSFETMSKGI